MVKTLIGCVIALGLGPLGACSEPTSLPGNGAAAGPATAGTGAQLPPPGAAGTLAAQRPPTAGTMALLSPLGAAGTLAAQRPPTAGTMAQIPPQAAGGTMAKELPRRTDLNPNVKFEWEETAPVTGKAKPCRAGLYTGMMMSVCNADGGGNGGLEIGGVISIELAESPDGEFLQISDGEFTSLAAGTFGLLAQLRGQLSCKTLQFSATTEGGLWGLGDPNVAGVPLGMFEAALTGALDPATGTLSGTWMVTGEVPLPCMGTWTATLSP